MVSRAARKLKHFSAKVERKKFCVVARPRLQTERELKLTARAVALGLVKETPRT